MTAPSASLTSWTTQLSTLTADVALALGPWLVEVAALLDGHDRAAAGDGEPDGFDGLSTRGTPERLLASEWLLASEEPSEFLRRAIDGELLHTAPSFQKPKPRGRIAVLCDCGPSQWGAPRLAQLAILLVLHRRAETSGIPLTLGLVGTKAGRWLEGGLEPMLSGWQRARHRSDFAPEDLDEWRRDLRPTDEIWLLSGSDRQVAGVHILTISESAWDASGVAEVTVRLDQTRKTLAMPPVEHALKALRGHGFRSAKQPATTSGLIRSARFPNGSRTLLGRGGDDRTLVTVHVPDGRPRRHGFSSPVIAAGLDGRRVIALVADRGSLRVEVIGKPIPQLAPAAWPLEDLPPLPAASDGLLPAVYTAGNHLLARLGDGWWKLAPEAAAAQVDVVACGYGAPPRVGSHTGEQIMISGAGQAIIPCGARVLFGASPAFSWSTDEKVWTTSAGKQLTVSDRARVIAMSVLRSDHVLISQSAGGQILHLITAAGVRTLTKWSGHPGTPAVHPARPWLAITKGDGTVIVVDFERDMIVATMRAPA
jgi:hypothetical protein